MALFLGTFAAASTDKAATGHLLNSSKMRHGCRDCQAMNQSALVFGLLQSVREQMAGCDGRPPLRSGPSADQLVVGGSSMIDMTVGVYCSFINHLKPFTVVIKRCIIMTLIVNIVMSS